MPSIALTVLLASATLASAQVTKHAVPGVTNFARVDATVACAGATTPAAVAEVKRLGYRTIVNLRLSDEAGANEEAEAAAARDAGMAYVHLPFSHSAPDAAVVEQFIKVVADPANQPVFIHCSSGNRAATLWLIKRVQVDAWDVDRAVEEAKTAGMTNPALEQFARDYIRTHRKQG